MTAEQYRAHADEERARRERCAAQHAKLKVKH